MPNGGIWKNYESQATNNNILVETNRTFMTQTNNLGGNKPGGIYASSDENGGVMAEPYRLHGKISEWIDSFDKNIANLLKDHEADFLNAYKDHMFLIQMELRELKGQIDAEHIKQKTNKRINRLEEERNLFRAQALDLDIKYKEQLKQIKSLKFQVEELDEEKRVFEAFVIGSQTLFDVSLIEYVSCLLGFQNCE